MGIAGFPMVESGVWTEQFHERSWFLLAVFSGSFKIRYVSDPDLVAESCSVLFVCSLW